MTDPPFRKHTRGFSPEALADVCYRYTETDETVASIAKSYGVSKDTVLATAKKHSWPMRRDRPPRGLAEAVRDNAPAEGAGVAPVVAAAASIEAAPTDATPIDAASIDAAAAANDALPLALRLEQAVVRELARVEQRHRAGGNMRPSESERVARTLSTLTQTLFKVRELRARDADGGAHECHDDMPADIDGFRDALARRIEAFVAGRADDELPAASGP